MKKIWSIIIVLFAVIVSITLYLWTHQRNDTMLMKHWIELIVLEALVLELSFLIKTALKRFLIQSTK